MKAAALGLLLAWTLFAFGAVYAWALWPAVLGALLIFLHSLWRSPATLFPRDTRLMDAALIAVIAGAAFQLVPVPAALRRMLAPSTGDFLSRVSIGVPSLEGWAPLSLAPDAWLFGAGAMISAILVYWSVRQPIEARGMRSLARWVAWLGLAVSILALVHGAVFPAGSGIYGFWQPFQRGTHPIGPVVSRNHFAAWVVLAWPLTVGYLGTHARTHWMTRKGKTGSRILGDTRALWVVAATAFLTAALLITESRAGVLGFACAVLFVIARIWRRMGGAGRAGLIAYLVIVAAVVSLWASPDAVLRRFERARSGADGGRPAIWRETLPLVEAFPITGIGLGAFDVVMPAYQTQSHAILINHAHNQYLHLVTEGGVLIALPLAAALVAFLIRARRALRDDRTPVVHIREGALAGLFGFAVFSLFDVPSLTPAVWFLAAVSAGIAVHTSSQDPRAPHEGRREPA